MKTPNIKILETEILGFEPYFSSFVTIAHINKDTKTIYPSHGYFYPHPYGKKTKKYAESINFTFNNN